MRALILHDDENSGGAARMDIEIQSKCRAEGAIANALLAITS